MEDVRAERPQGRDVGGEVTPIVIVARTRHDERPCSRTCSRDPVDNRLGHAHDGGVDVRLEAAEEMHETEVGAAQLLRIRVRDEPHERLGDNTHVGPFVEIQRGVIVGANCKIASAAGSTCSVSDLLALEVGDEVIVPANTYIATALAVSEVGGDVVLVDCDAATYNIDPQLVEAAVTSRTKVLLPVHSPANFASSSQEGRTKRHPGTNRRSGRASARVRRLGAVKRAPL